MKTPKQVAKSWRGAFEVRDGDVQETSWSYIKGVIAEAIEADRAQRGLVDAVAEALDERAEAGADDAEVARAAAARIRDTDPLDDVWHNYLGPMLDELQNDYGMEQE